MVVEYDDFFGVVYGEGWEYYVGWEFVEVNFGFWYCFCLLFDEGFWYFFVWYVVVVVEYVYVDFCGVEVV